MFQAGASFVDPFCYLCFVSAMLSCLFIAAVQSPAGKGLTSWLSVCEVFLLFFVTFQSGVLGHVWYLIELIPDLCLLPYFDVNSVS